MPITKPWLAGPTPQGLCPREVVEEPILNLLPTHDTAVIATVAADGSPAAMPVRCSSLGTEIITSWDASPRSRNLRRDPRVLGGIVAPLVGRASSRGAQLFGTARTLWRDGGRGADGYWEAAGSPTTSSAGAAWTSRPTTPWRSSRPIGSPTPATGCGTTATAPGSSGAEERAVLPDSAVRGPLREIAERTLAEGGPPR